MRPFALLFLTSFALAGAAQQSSVPPASEAAPSTQPAQSPAAIAASPGTAPTSFAEDLKAPATDEQGKLRQMFERNIQAEWEAIKNRDAKTYSGLLAADYEGVEVDGKGERTKSQMLDELNQSNISNYTLWGFKLLTLVPDAALAIYEVTIQFPPKSVVRYSRVYISELWQKQSGEWKIVHYQETHVK